MTGVAEEIGPVEFGGARDFSGFIELLAGCSWVGSCGSCGVNGPKFFVSFHMMLKRSRIDWCSAGLVAAGMK